MKWKTTLVLLIITVGVGAYVSLYELKQPDPERRQELARQVVQINPDTVTELSAAFPVSTVAWTHQGGAWRLTSPVASRADEAAVQRILDELNPLDSEQVMAGSSAAPLALPQYGLEPARGTLSVTTGSQTTTLRFGDPTAVGHHRYLALAQAPTKVWVISAGLFEALDQPGEAFRSHELVTFDAGKVRQITVIFPPHAYTLTKSAPPTEAAGTERADHWQVTAPLAPGVDPGLADAADGAAVSTILSKLRGLRIEQFPKKPSEGAFASPYATITIGEAQDQPPTLTLTVGAEAADHPEQRYAKRSDEPFLYTVASAKIGELLQDPQTLRAKTCFEFFASQATRFQWTWQGTTRTLEKDGERWQAAGTREPLDGSKAEEFLWKVRDVQAVRFVDDAPSDLARYGLDPAQGTIQVWLSGHPDPQTLLVGSAIAQGPTRYGRIAGRAPVVELPELITSILATTPDAFTPTSETASTAPPVHSLSRESGSGVSPGRHAGSRSRR